MEIFLICSFQHIRLATRRHVVKEELAAVQLRYCSALEKALEHKQTRGVPGKRLPKRGTALVVNNKMLQTKGSSLGAFADWVGRIRHVTSETWAGTNHVCVVTEAPTQLWRYNCKLRRLTTDAVLQTAVEAEKLEVLAFWYRPEGYLFVTTDQSVWIKPHENPLPKRTQAVLSNSTIGHSVSGVVGMKKFASRSLFFTDAPTALIWGNLGKPNTAAAGSEYLINIDLRSGAATQLQLQGLNAVGKVDKVLLLDNSIYVFRNTQSQISKLDRDGASGSVWKTTQTSLEKLGFSDHVRSFMGCLYGLVFCKVQSNPNKIAYTLVDKTTLKVLHHLTGKGMNDWQQGKNPDGVQVPTKLGLVLLLFFPVHGYLDVVLARPGKLHWVVHNKTVKDPQASQCITMVCMNTPQKSRLTTRADATSQRALIYTAFLLHDNSLGHRFVKIRLPA